MSSGPFIRSKYTDGNGNTRPIRIQPETVSDWNPVPADPASGEPVRVSGGKRQIGRKARSVTLVQGVGPVTDGYQARKTTTLPVLTQAAWDALTPGQAVAYADETWEVAGLSLESGRFK